MDRTLKFGDYMAEVEGSKSNGSKVSFKLRTEEIKHIRRMISLYDRIFARDIRADGDHRNLTKTIYAKFSKFGKINRRMSTVEKRKKMENVERVCVHPGCKERVFLTVDHKIRLTAKANNPNAKSNLQYLCPKHHLLKELETHKVHKEQELSKINKRIADIEKKNTTDCLGYQVIDQNKFEQLDEPYKKQEKE